MSLRDRILQILDQPASHPTLEDRIYGLLDKEDPSQATERKRVANASVNMVGLPSVSGEPQTEAQLAAGFEAQKAQAEQDAKLPYPVRAGAYLASAVGGAANRLEDSWRQAGDVLTGRRGLGDAAFELSTSTPTNERVAPAILSQIIPGSAPVLSPAVQQRASEVGSTLDPVSRFAADMATLPIEFAQPKAIAAAILARAPVGAANASLASRAMLGTVGQRFGPKVMRATEMALWGASEGAATNAIQTGLEGGDLGDVAYAGTVGGVLGAGLGGAAGAMSGPKGFARKQHGNKEGGAEIAAARTRPHPDSDNIGKSLPENDLRVSEPPIPVADDIGNETPTRRQLDADATPKTAQNQADARSLAEGLTIGGAKVEPLRTPKIRPDQTPEPKLTDVGTVGRDRPLLGNMGSVEASGQVPGTPAASSQNDGGAMLYHRGRDPRTSKNIVMFADNRDSIHHYGENEYQLPASAFVEVPKWASDFAREYGLEAGSVNPRNIVNSAEAWDDAAFVSEFWQAHEDELLAMRDRGIYGFKTPDGGVVFPGPDVPINVKSSAGLPIPPTGGPRAKVGADQPGQPVPTETAARPAEQPVPQDGRTPQGQGQYPEAEKSSVAGEAHTGYGTAPTPPKDYTARRVVDSLEPGEQPGPVTGIRHAMTAETRRLIGAESYDGPERRSFMAALDTAVAQGVPERSLRIAAEVNQTPRTLSDIEQMGMLHKSVELIEEMRAVKKTIDAEADPAVIRERGAELARIEDELEAVTNAMDLGGSELGRSLNARKAAMNENYQLATVKIRAKAAKGSALTPEESARFDTLTKQLEDTNTKLASVEKQLADQQAEMAIRRHAPARRRLTPQQLDAEYGALLSKARDLLAKGCD